MTLSITEIAEKLDCAAQEAKAIPQISAETPLTIEEAYLVQKESIDRRIERGERIVGYKLGFTSKAKMEQMGVHEIIWGRLTDAMEIKEALNLSKYVHPRAEPEIAFRFCKELDCELNSENYSDYIDGVAVALEVIDSRYENFKFSLEDVIADNCSSTGYKLGEWKNPSTSLKDLRITLEFNDELKHEGNSNSILGNPKEALFEASRIFLREGIELKEGMFLLAGAATPATFLEKESRARAFCQGLEKSEIEIR